MTATFAWLPLCTLVNAHYFCAYFRFSTSRLQKQQVNMEGWLVGYVPKQKPVKLTAEQSSERKKITYSWIRCQQTQEEISTGMGERDHGCDLTQSTCFVTRAVAMNRSERKSAFVLMRFSMFSWLFCETKLISFHHSELEVYFNRE